MAKRRQFDEAYRASALALAEEVTVPIAAAQLSLNPSVLYRWRNDAQEAEEQAEAAAKANFPTPKPLTPSPAPVRKRTTAWSDEDYCAVASEWVSLRLADPLESATVLAERAQRKVFDGRGELQRDIPSVKNVAPLVRSICTQWKELLDRPAAPPPAPGEPPMPEIITLEVPRKWTAEEMLAHLDEPSLEALMTAKRLAREAQHNELLYALATHAGAKVSPLKPFQPRFEAFHEPTTKTRRIALVGVPVPEQAPLLAAVKEAGLDAALRFPDGKDRDTLSHCDYAIICRAPAANNHTALNAADGDRAIGELGRSRVVLLDTHIQDTIVQQLRNLLSRR